METRFADAPLESLHSFFNSLEEDGFLSIEKDDFAKLTLKGKLVADRIAVEFLDLALCH